MTAPEPTNHPGSLRGFLVERYLSPAGAQELTAATTRLHRLCQDPATDVRYLYAAYLPTQDTCFCLFHAASRDDVAAVNRRAHFDLDQITDATVLICTPTPPGLGNPNLGTTASSATGRLGPPRRTP